MSGSTSKTSELENASRQYLAMVERLRGTGELERIAKATRQEIDDALDKADPRGAAAAAHYRGQQGSSFAPKPEDPFKR